LNGIGFDIQPLPPFPLSSHRIKSIAVSDPRLSSREFLDGNDPVYIIGSGKTAMDCARYLIQNRGARQRSVNVIAGSGMWFLVRDTIYPPGIQRYVRGTPITNVFLDACEMYDGHNESALVESFRRRGLATTVWGFGGNFRNGLISLAEREELRAGVDRVFRGHLVDVQGTRMTIRQAAGLQEHSVPEGAYFINCTSHLLPQAHQPVLQDSGLVCAPQLAAGLSGMSAYFITHLWMRNGLGPIAHELFRLRLDVEPKLALLPHFALMTAANFALIGERLPMSIAARYAGDFTKWYPAYRRLPVIARLGMNGRRLRARAEQFLKVRYSDAPSAMPAVASASTTELHERTFAAE
jgi:hypothetical protein